MKKLIVLAVALVLAVTWGGLAFATVPDSSQGTYTIGYWKTHAGFGPQADKVTPLLPIWLGTEDGDKSVRVSSARTAVDILKMSGGASNGIVKLYAQLLGAKLNKANGASGSAVRTAIHDADAFLATHCPADWAGLSAAEKSQVLSWADKLDDYNNGVIGPGHAS